VVVQVEQIWVEGLLATVLMWDQYRSLLWVVAVLVIKDFLLLEVVVLLILELLLVTISDLQVVSLVA
jgi:hypothetical protein